MNYLSSIKNSQNFVCNFIQDNVFTNLTPLQKKVRTVVLLALTCLATLYLYCRYCLKKESVQPASQQAGSKILPRPQTTEADEIEVEHRDSVQADRLDKGELKLKINPLDFIRKVNSGWTKLQPDLDAKLEVSKSALDAKPDDSKLMYDYGEVLRMQGKYEEASEIFKKACSLNPRSYKAFILLSYGESLLMQGKFDEASDILKQAVALNNAYLPDLILCWYGLALQLQGKEKEALEQIEVALNTLPDPDPIYWGIEARESSVLHHYSEILLMQNKPQEAIERLDAAVKKDPKNRIALYIYGEALRMQGKDKEALEKFEVALDPQDFAVMKQEIEGPSKT